jgi:DNA-binding NarL/FixJ family response regulator
MAEGLTNVEIADKLDLSPKTISNVSQAIKDKLGIHRPALITKLAVKYGLIEA